MVEVLRYRGITALFSSILFASFVGFAFHQWYTHGHVFNYSVDFTGGTQVLLRFDQPVSSGDLRSILEQSGWEGATTRDFEEKEIMVRVKDFSNDAKGVAEKMRDAVVTAIPDRTVEVLQSESVGPGVGKALQWKSIRAVLISLVAMLLYIALRFWSFGFALGSVAALFHDSIVMLALFLFFQREVSVNVIGAILAVLGYSINDTIVIFSQIRENIKRMQHATMEEIINKSIAQTLKRTLLTSISTGLTVGAMLILGGEALRDFSLALLAGIIFGTYSSIYIASPVMLLLYNKKS